MKRIFLVALLFLAACERPRQRDAPEAGSPPVPPAAGTGPSAAPAPPGSPAESAPAAPAEGAAAAVSEDDLPPADPELSVARVGDKILVSGALRSRIQVERIVSDLTREFPDHQIESDLKVEYHRIPVGWGNRVSAVMLVDFLHLVESPRISYKEGIVTLEGRVPDETLQRTLVEMAVDTFTGDTTQDLVNRLVVTGDGEKAKGKAKEKSKGKAEEAEEAGGESGKPEAKP